MLKLSYRRHPRESGVQYSRALRFHDRVITGIPHARVMTVNSGGAQCPSCFPFPHIAESGIRHFPLLDPLAAFVMR